MRQRLEIATLHVQTGNFILTHLEPTVTVDLVTQNHTCYWLCTSSTSTVATVVT